MWKNWRKDKAVMPNSREQGRIYIVYMETRARSNPCFIKQDVNEQYNPESLAYHRLLLKGLLLLLFSFPWAHSLYPLMYSKGMCCNPSHMDSTCQLSLISHPPFCHTWLKKKKEVEIHREETNMKKWLFDNLESLSPRELCWTEYVWQTESSMELIFAATAL